MKSNASKIKEILDQYYLDEGSQEVKKREVDVKKNPENKAHGNFVDDLKPQQKEKVTERM